jgi:hypothetical protein
LNDTTPGPYGNIISDLAFNFNEMKKLLIFLSFFICISVDAQKGNLILSKWHKSENGQSKVPSGEYSFFKKSKLWYFLSNDNDNMYISLKIEDPGVQNRILKEGLTIWINMDGKSSKKMGVRFPIGSQNSEGSNRSGIPETKTNIDGSLVTPLAMANTIELVGFSNEVARRFPADSNDNFKGSIEFDTEGNLYYRMAMPVAKLPVRNSKDGNGAMPFTIGVEYGSVPQTTKGGGGSAPPTASLGPPPGGVRGRSSGGGRTGGGGSGGSGQGGGSSASGSSSSSYQNASPSVVLWIKNIKLATGR